MDSGKDSTENAACTLIDNNKPGIANFIHVES